MDILGGMVNALVMRCLPAYRLKLGQTVGTSVGTTLPHLVCSCVSCVSCDVFLRHTCALSEEIPTREEAPLAVIPEGQFLVLSGARGIRTPKPFRALAFEASAIPFCQRSKQLGAGAEGSLRDPRSAGGFQVVVE